MVRVYYVRELQRLQDEILVLGSMVSEAIFDSVKALRAHDVEAAQRIVAYDRVINAKKFELEESCLTLIATQQPTAGDLRLLAAILEISTELERMGDYAKGISRITIYIGREPMVKPMPEISQMCEKAMDMMRRALDAFASKDVEAARAIPLEDDVLDELYNQINRRILDMIIKDPSVTDHANYLSWAAHNLERAGDRVTNICERVIYTGTGMLVEFDARDDVEDAE